MTDPNVIALLELLAHRTFWNESSPARTEAIRLVGVLRAAAEKHAAQTDGPVGIGMGGALLYPPGRAEKPAEPLGGWASDGWASEPAEKPPAPPPIAMPMTAPKHVAVTLNEGGSGERYGVRINGMFRIDCTTRDEADRIADALNRAEKPAEAAPVAAVKFDSDGCARLAKGPRADRRGIEGWEAEEYPEYLVIRLTLRPGEDAGETLAKMLAPVGRTA